MVEPSAGVSTKAGALPVWLAPVAADGQEATQNDVQRGAPVAPGAKSSVHVEVTDAKTAASAGSRTNLVALTPTDPSNAAKLRVSLDASAFGAGLGGDWSQRARLYTLPACSLTTPRLRAAWSASPSNRTTTPRPGSWSPTSTCRPPLPARPLRRPRRQA